jgi:two-component system, sensor histidine kinase
LDIMAMSANSAAARLGRSRGATAAKTVKSSFMAAADAARHGKIAFFRGVQGASMASIAEHVINSERVSGSAETASEQRELLILVDQLRAIDNQQRVAALAHALAAVLLVVALHGRVSTILLGLWAFGASLSIAAALGWSVAFRRANPGTQEARTWAFKRTLVYLALGVAWGVAGGVLFPSGDMASQALIMMIVTGLAAGALTVSAIYLPCNWALVVPMLVPVIVRSALEGGALHGIIAVLLAVYLGYILAAARNVNRVVKQSLNMRYENADLIEALTAEKTAAEAARQEAEQANRAKSQFLAAASHDLRQPLHALGLFAAALDARIRYPEVRHIVNNISASIDALEALFNELLDVSKLDAGVILPARSSFAVQPLLERMLTDYGSQAAQRGVELRIAPSRLVLDSDPMLLERILRNLVSNAIRYTPKGKVLVGVRRAGAMARIEVWDTGTGIPEDQHQRIFEEFYQLTNPERDRSKGLGLGLAIVQRLTRLLDHRLVMDSQLGKGSVFRVSVPLGRFTELTRASYDGAEALVVAGSGKHIVFIDDEAAVREGMDTLLKQWGYTVTIAGSLEEMLRKLEHTVSGPDLIIADYRLRAGASGAEAIRRIQEEYGATIAGILITGDTAPDRILEARASGYELLHKPVPPARLRSLIGVMTERGQTVS